MIYIWKVCFYVELCRPNLIITKGTVNLLILEPPKVTLCTMQLLFILCEIWKQAYCVCLAV